MLLINKLSLNKDLDARHGLRVERCGKALAATPEDVGLCRELLADLEHLLRLCAAESKGVEVRSRRSSVFVSRMREKVLRRPQPRPLNKIPLTPVDFIKIS